MSDPSTDPNDCNHCLCEECSEKADRLSLLENIVDYSDKDPIPKDCHFFIENPDSLYFGRDPVDYPDSYYSY